MVFRSKHAQLIAMELAANIAMLALCYAYIAVRLIGAELHLAPAVRVELLATPLVTLALVRVLFAVRSEHVFRRVTATVDVTAARNEVQPYREDVVLRQCDLGGCVDPGDAVCKYCERAVCAEHRDAHAWQELAPLARPLNVIYIALRVAVFLFGLTLLMGHSGRQSPFDAAAVTEDRLVIQFIAALVCVLGAVVASGNKDRVEQALERLLPWARGRRWPAEAAATLFTALTGLLVYCTALGIIIHADANFSWVPAH